MSEFLKAVNERVVIYDGAMGTQIQARNLALDDYWGNEGCSEILVLSRPDVIRDIHAAYFEAGADVVETNTFGATRIVLGEYDLQARSPRSIEAAVRIAKEVAVQFSTPRAPALRRRLRRPHHQASLASVISATTTCSQRISNR